MKDIKYHSLLQMRYRKCFQSNQVQHQIYFLQQLNLQKDYYLQEQQHYLLLQSMILEEDLPALMKGLTLSNSLNEAIRKRVQQKIN